MNKLSLVGRLIALVGLAASSLSAAGKITWPDLPTSGFISGRPATIDDAKAGNAVFSTNGTGGGAVAITIPQYVFWSDAEGRKYPMILVQAEKAPDGSTIVGLRDFAGGETVGTWPEIELLGTKKPN